MITETIAVEAINPPDHEEWMHLAAVELDRVLALADDLDETEFAQPTDCAGWDVKALLGHLLGMLELQTDPGERARQLAAANEAFERTGGLGIDALTGLQVAEHAKLTIDELRQALHTAAPRGLAARRALPEQVRNTPYDPMIPGAGIWTVGYLFDTIHTRDPWMHRIDLCRATERTPELTPAHDDRIVADVVREWASRHGRGFTLVLDGPAGGAFVAGDGAEQLRLDAVEFCRILSGRSNGNGLFSTLVPF